MKCIKSNELFCPECGTDNLNDMYFGRYGEGSWCKKCSRITKYYKEIAYLQYKSKS